MSVCLRSLLPPQEELDDTCLSMLEVQEVTAYCGPKSIIWGSPKRLASVDPDNSTMPTLTGREIALTEDNVTRVIAAGDVSLPGLKRCGTRKGTHSCDEENPSSCSVLLRLLTRDCDAISNLELFPEATKMTQGLTTTRMGEFSKLRQITIAKRYPAPCPPRGRDTL